MTDDDRTAQVPVSRIRDTVDSAMQKHAYGILLPLQDNEFTAVVEDITAAVAALLSQPTPTAESCTCPSGDGSLRWPCPVHPPADAHDAKGMAPGTVLRGKVHGQYLERTLVATGDCFIDTVTRIAVPRDLLDPTSVRHVTSPPGGGGG